MANDLYQWCYQVSATGNVGSNIDVTPGSGQDVAGTKEAVQFIINAPFAESTATIDIWADTATAGNLVFSGRMFDRDRDNSIVFPAARSATTKFIVKVTGGSGATYILLRHR